MRRLTRKRLRSSLSADLAAEECVRRILDQLQVNPDVAETVLTAPCAHVDTSPLDLVQLHDMLPDALHAAAARGFFGADATEWRFNLARRDALRAATRTLQLLPLQLRVTAVRLTDSIGRPRRKLLSRLALSTQVTAIALEGVRFDAAIAKQLHLGYNRLGNPCAAALAMYIGALTQLRGLDIVDCDINHPEALAHEILRLPRLERLACRQCFAVEEFMSSGAAQTRGIALVDSLVF